MRDVLSVEEATKAVQGTGHAIELQSIRGLAALVVVLHHCTFYFKYDEALKYVLEVALNAHASVVAFFVLSGLVLTKSWASRPLHFNKLARFYIRRAFRIYPALWASIIIALAYTISFYHIPLPPVVDRWWSHGTRNAVANTYTVVSTLSGNRTHLPLPIWTLQVELVGSLLIPGIAWLAAYRIRMFVVALLVLSFISLTEWHMGPSQYLVDFGLGATIARLEGSLRNVVSNMSAVLIGLFAFCIMWFGRLPFDARFMHDYDAKFPALLEGFGAMVVIAVIFYNPRPFRFLRMSVATWLGDISYSLYLVHIPILAIIGGLGVEVLRLPIFVSGGIAATCALLLCTLFISVPLAALFYRFIEIPGIRAGKAFDKAVRKRLTDVGPW